MADIKAFEAGAYRYVPGPFQYSCGVAAQPGFAIERVRFREPVPVEKGFLAIASHLANSGRPVTAFCACELRSPAPFTEPEFVAFNRVYVGTLERWGIFRDDDNPVARSNVCPAVHPPAEPSFHAFSYTVPDPSNTAAGTLPSFVVSGAAEASEGPGSYADRIIRLGDRSPDAMREKAGHVLDAMERRMTALGTNWAEATAVHAYSVFDIHPLLDTTIVPRIGSVNGLTWHYARPPVEGLDYEMDVRGVATERVI